MYLDTINEIKCKHVHEQNILKHEFSVVCPPNLSELGGNFHVHDAIAIIVA